MKDKIIKYIKTLFQEEDDYYKPIKEGNFWNNYIEYESNGKNKPYEQQNTLTKLNPS